MIEAIVKDLVPKPLEQPVIGLNSAAQLLLTAGDNPELLKSETSFAALCGGSPVTAPSGKTVRHRRSRGGDCAAHSAIHIVAIGRLCLDPRTQAYVAKRTALGNSKLETVRSLARYIAREVFNHHAASETDQSDANCHHTLSRASKDRNTRRSRGLTGCADPACESRWMVKGGSWTTSS